MGAHQSQVATQELTSKNEKKVPVVHLPLNLDRQEYSTESYDITRSTRSSKFPCALNRHRSRNVSDGDLVRLRERERERERWIGGEYDQ
jgi:hypothetical protein